MSALRYAKRVPRLMTVAVLAGALANGPATASDSSAKTISRLTSELDSTDHDLAEAAKYELGKRGEAAVPALVALVKDRTAAARHRAVISLGLVKDPATVPVLIECLEDKDWQVRGRAAYALSQIGGDPARDALAAFLDRCVNEEAYRVNLKKATESLKELPDPRALPAPKGIDRYLTLGAAALSEAEA